MIVLSGTRTARSMLSPDNAVEVALMEFPLGARQGIELMAILGTVGVVNFTYSTTPSSALNGMQTLHLEAGALEDVPFTVAEDGVLIDTEVAFTQRLHSHQQSVGNAAGDGSHGSTFVTPTGLVDLRGMNIYSARNLTHRAEAANNVEIVFDLLLYYRYVEFSLSELGLVLARSG